MNVTKVSNSGNVIQHFGVALSLCLLISNVGGYSYAMNEVDDGVR